LILKDTGLIAGENAGMLFTLAEDERSSGRHHTVPPQERRVKGTVDQWDFEVWVIHPFEQKKARLPAEVFLITI
jgi:hypothetical protein